MKVGHFEDGSKFSLFETQLSKVKSPKRGCRFKSWVGNVYSTCHIPTRIHLQCLLLIHYSNFSYYCPNSKVWKCLQMLSLESKIRPSFASFQISCRGRKKEGVNSLGEDSFGLLKKRLYPPFPLLICDCISCINSPVCCVVEAHLLGFLFTAFHFVIYPDWFGVLRDVNAVLSMGVLIIGHKSFVQLMRPHRVQ